MTDADGLRAAVPLRGPLFARIRFYTRYLADTALDFVFPPRCIQCRRAGSLLCPDCQLKIESPAAVRDPDGVLDERRATAVFEGAIRQAIHAFKYDNRFRYAQVLAERLSAEYTRSGWDADVICAVPLHPARLAERGYNQAGLLADRLAAAVHVAYRGDVLTRVRETRHQVGLNYAERQTNVTDAFAANQRIVEQKKVVIIDDVYTTGATLRACASALRQAGATHIWGLTVCSASQHGDAPDVSV
jgi:ComF family protein